MKQKQQPFIILEKNQNIAIVLDIVYIKSVILGEYGRLKSAEEQTAEYITKAEPENYCFNIKQCYKFYLN